MDRLDQLFARSQREIEAHADELGDIGAGRYFIEVTFRLLEKSRSKTRSVDANRLAELAALLNRQADDLTDDELVQAVRLADEDRDAARERVERLLAALYLRGRLSWPKLGELTGIPYGTAHGLARPYIPRDDDAR